MSRQVGSALGVGILVSVVGTHPAGTASFGHAWILVLTAAVMTGLARLASSGPKAASQRMDTTRPAVQRTGAGAE